MKLFILPLILLFLQSWARANDVDDVYSEFLEGEKCASSPDDCLKIDTLEAVADKLAEKRSVRLFPGLVLEMGGYARGREENGTTKEDSASLNKFISSNLEQFFSSVALKIKVVDKETVDKISRLTSDLTSGGESRGFRPRFRRPANATNTALLGSLISAATMLVMALSALAAMAGKAVAMSTVSLAVSMMHHNHRDHGGGWNAGNGKAVEVHHTHSTSIGALPAPVNLPGHYVAPMPPASQEPYKGASNYIK